MCCQSTYRTVILNTKIVEEAGTRLFRGGNYPQRAEEEEQRALGCMRATFWKSEVLRGERKRSLVVDTFVGV